MNKSLDKELQMRLGSPEEMFYVLSFGNSFIEECIVTIFVSRNDETTEKKKSERHLQVVYCSCQLVLQKLDLLIPST